MFARRSYDVWAIFSFLKKVRWIIAFGALIVIVLCGGIVRTFKEVRFSPAALLGYVVCDAREFEDRLPLFSEDYPCIFSSPVPTVNGLTVVTFVNTGWINLTKNWLYSAEKNGLKGSILLITMEPGVCEHFSNVACYHDESVGIRSASFGEPRYQTFMVQRTRLILQLLSCGSKSIMLSDADIVFLTNPVQTIEEELGTNDIILQHESTGVQSIDVITSYMFDYICGGFIYFKVNDRTRLLYQAVFKYQQHYSWNDQAGVNVCIRHHTLSAQWKVFSNKFANGKSFFDFRSSPSDVVLVHASFKKGSVDKIGSMISRGIWFYDEIAPDLCRELWPKACQQRRMYSWCEEFRVQCMTKYNVKL